MTASLLPIRLILLLVLATGLVSVVALAQQPPAEPIRMAGKMLMVSNDEGTTEQRFRADGTYVLRPVGMLAVLNPKDIRTGRWRMVSDTMVCSRQTEPIQGEENCLNLTDRRVGESWSVLAVRGGNTQLVILEMEPEKVPGDAGS